MSAGELLFVKRELVKFWFDDFDGDCYVWLAPFVDRVALRLKDHSMYRFDSRLDFPLILCALLRQ